MDREAGLMAEGNSAIFDFKEIKKVLNQRNYEQIYPIEPPPKAEVVTWECDYCGRTNPSTNDIKCTGACSCEC
jgi:hypothetical protein